MVRSKESLMAAYAFSIGVILAILLGFFNNSLESASGIFYTLLIIIGILIGYFSTSDKGTTTFLLASIAIVIVGGMGIEPLLFVAKSNVVVDILRNILSSLMVLFIPATIIVALKTIFSVTKI